MVARSLLRSARMWAPHAPGGLSWTRLQTVWVGLATATISLCVPARPGGDVPPRDHRNDSRPPGTWRLYEDVLEVNAAGAADFELLPGIGPAIAQRLVDARETAGGWCTVTEMAEAARIGSRRWASVAPLVSVRPAPRCSSSS